MLQYSHELSGQSTINSGSVSDYLPEFVSYINPFLKKTPS
jgi:hypothetical protein